MGTGNWDWDWELEMGMGIYRCKVKMALLSPVILSFDIGELPVFIKYIYMENSSYFSHEQCIAVFIMTPDQNNDRI